METQVKNVTLIQLNRRYLKIISSYLEKNKYRFTILHGDNNDEKVKVKIHALNPEDAFYLGVNAQVQLIDGEILI